MYLSKKKETFEREITDERNVTNNLFYFTKWNKRKRNLRNVNPFFPNTFSFSFVKFSLTSHSYFSIPSFTLFSFSNGTPIINEMKWKMNTVCNKLVHKNVNDDWTNLGNIYIKWELVKNYSHSLVDQSWQFSFWEN